MCDTLVAVGAATADGRVIFAKNSDREPNEAQALVFVPRAEHPAGETVRCTYIEIPQVRTTHAMLLSKPFWMWGCEMGINEHGVTIGNEAVFTKEPYKKKGGLLGMDLMRLALERARTARAALDVITDSDGDLRAGGNGGYTHKLFYTTPTSSPTPTRRGCWRRGRRTGPRSKWRFTQFPTRRPLATRCGSGVAGAVAHAVGKRVVHVRSRLRFRALFFELPCSTRLSGSGARRTCSMNQLVAEDGDIAVETMMDVLRDHGVKVRERAGDLHRQTLTAIACTRGLGLRAPANRSPL